jgi:hypothetical protein
MRRPQTASPDNQAALGLIGLAVLIHMLRSRRFYERVAVGAIVLAAVRSLGQEKRASTFERLAAWNKRQVEILERKAERQALRVEREAKRQARRLERTAKRQARRLTVRAKLGPADRELGQTDGQLAAGAGGRWGWRCCWITRSMSGTGLKSSGVRPSGAGSQAQYDLGDRLVVDLVPDYPGGAGNGPAAVGGREGDERGLHCPGDLAR